MKFKKIADLVDFRGTEEDSQQAADQKLATQQAGLLSAVGAEAAGFLLAFDLVAGRGHLVPMLSVAVLACVFGILRLRRTGRPVLVGHLLCVSLLLIGGASTLIGGNFASTAPGWVGLIPAVALLTTGPARGLAWSAAAVLLLLGSALLPYSVPLSFWEPWMGANLPWAIGEALLLGVFAVCVAGCIASRLRALRAECQRAMELLSREKESRRAAEQRLSAADRARSDIVSTLGYESRTPMNGIEGMARLLLETDLDGHQREFAQNVLASAKQLRRHFDFVVELDRMESGELRLEHAPFDLNVLIAGVAQHHLPACEEGDLSLFVRIAPQAPRFLTGDQMRLRQVVSSYVDRSLKTSDGGVLFVEVEQTNDGEASVELEFSVWNGNPLLSEEDRERLHDSLVSDEEIELDADSRQEHGLALCRGLIELMGGKVGYRHDEQRGTCLWARVTLPVAREPHNVQLFDGGLKNARVLVIEDQEIPREILMEQLAYWGMNSVAADSCQEGLNMLELAADGHRPFAAALVDHQVLDMDLDAFGAAIRRRPDLADTAFVLLTNETGRGAGRRFAEAGFPAYLAKPVMPSILHDTLAMAIGVRGGSNQPTTA